MYIKEVLYIDIFMPAVTSVVTVLSVAAVDDVEIVLVAVKVVVYVVVVPALAVDEVVVLVVDEEVVTAVTIVAVSVAVVIVVVITSLLFVTTVGISVSSAMTAKLDKWLDKHLTLVELTKISVEIPSLDQLVRVSVLCMKQYKISLL